MNQNDHMLIPVLKGAWTTEAMHVFLRATADASKDVLERRGIYLSQNLAFDGCLTLTELVVVCLPARVHLFFWGKTAGAKSLTAEVLARVYGGNRIGKVDCQGDLNDSIFHHYETSQDGRGLAVVSSALMSARVNILEEANHVLSICQPALKVLTSGGLPAGMVISTGNLGDAYKTQQLDRSITSSHAHVLADLAAGVSDLDRLILEGPRLMGDLTEIEPLRAEDGELVLDHLTRLRPEVRRLVGLTGEARVILLALSLNACCKSRRVKPDRPDSICAECSCSSASACGAVGWMPRGVLAKLSLACRALAVLRTSGSAEKVRAGSDEILTLAPFLLNSHTADFKENEPDAVLGVIRELSKSIQRFLTHHEDLVRKVVTAPNAVLTRAEEQMISAFAASDNPSVPIAVLHAARAGALEEFPASESAATVPPTLTA
jgi:hypothetical protein